MAINRHVYTLVRFLFVFFLISPSPINSQTNTSSSSSPSPSIDPKKLIEEVCKEATVTRFCMNVLQSNPECKNASNLIDFAKASLRLVIVNASETLKYFDQMIKDKNTTPILKIALDSCVNSYKQAISSLEASIDGISNDVMWSNQDTMYANDALQACANTMAEEELSQESNMPIIIDKNGYMRSLGNLAFDITTFVLEKQNN